MYILICLPLLRNIRGATSFAPYWVFLVSGLPMYILSILYLLTGIPLLGLPVSFR